MDNFYWNLYYFNKWNNFLKWEKEKKYDIWDPEDLHNKLSGKNNSKKKDWKNIYRRYEIKKLGMKDKKGRNVQVWRLVESSENDINEDSFVPIYLDN